MKRIISFMMCVGMIASILAVSAFAENTADKGGLSVDKTVVTTQGEDKTITVTSKIPAIEAADVNNVTMSITFDNSVLEYVGSTPDSNIFKITDGATALGNKATSVAKVNENAEFAQACGTSGGFIDLSAGHTTQITFKVKDGAAVGSTTLQYNMQKLKIKSATTSYVPEDWNTAVTVDVITDYITAVDVSGVAVSTGEALPTSVTLSTTDGALVDATAAVTWTTTEDGKPASGTAEDQDYSFTIANIKAKQADGVSYRFADEVTVTGLEDFSDVEAVVSGDNKDTLTITGNYVSRMLGDVDGDGEITMDDAIQILNYVLNEESVINTDTVAAKAADVDKSGEIDMDDAIQILNYVLGEDSILG